MSEIPSEMTPEPVSLPTPEVVDWNVVMANVWHYGENLIAALLTVVIGAIAIVYLVKAADKALEKSRVDGQIRRLARKLAKVGLWLIVLIMVLSRFGVQTASIIAVLGALGLAVGLALQGTLSNIASGVMILVLKPFKAGQVIKVGADVYIIDDIGIFVTCAHQPEGPKVTIPNNRLWGNEIVNLSTNFNDVKRIDQIIGISYSDDIDKAFAVAQQVLDSDQRFLKDPEPLIAVSDLGDSSVNILVRVWAPGADWWLAKLHLTKALKQAFDEAGLTIPFPQRDVHMWPATSSQSAVGS